MVCCLMSNGKSESAEVLCDCADCKLIDDLIGRDVVSLQKPKLSYHDATVAYLKDQGLYARAPCVIRKALAPQKKRVKVERHDVEPEFPYPPKDSVGLDDVDDPSDPELEVTDDDEGDEADSLFVLAAAGCSSVAPVHDQSEIARVVRDYHRSDARMFVDGDGCYYSIYQFTRLPFKEPAFKRSDDVP